ncbi:protease inhibitor Inh/omp19 family protein [Mesorhizobium sp. LHD-90]|uniref:protease inhibitor Inh/omp19 family protein n=1 Tax=Mesorhizobium sp. LHD-90 TaxID=3071414 RepID=UPI0027DFD747|nr:protease inhibitor Inh/omp19 family protein [Mesorhizobium sp. LHD-90]MDQ6437065.1 protease inhibitor Inh/omp19 family protein [Mesorhizobium sp. LHD-90]
MAFSRTGILLAAVTALAVSGCQSSRFGSVEERPAPLPAAPSGPVTSNKLPPPAPANPAAFPTAPTPAEPAVAAAPAGPPPDAPDLTPSTVGGVWNVSVSGQNCKIATSQTKFGQGFRAGPLRCPAPVDGVKSWSVAGKQLSLYDENGAVAARLYSSGPEKFDGQTETGVPISFSR